MMTIGEEEYLSDCRRTWSPICDDDLEHCIIGISTEAGELLDAYKKHKFYGRELDVRNIKEELGDLQYYVTILNDTIGYSTKDARIDNIKKLRKRYDNLFNDVIIRDQDKELDHIHNEIEDSLNAKG